MKKNQNVIGAKKSSGCFFGLGKKHSDVFVQSIDFDFDRLERKLIIDFFWKEEMNLFLISSLEEGRRRRRRKEREFFFFSQRLDFEQKKRLRWNWISFKSRASGCGTVARAVAADTGDPRFISHGSMHGIVKLKIKKEETNKSGAKVYQVFL